MSILRHLIFHRVLYVVGLSLLSSLTQPLCALDPQRTPTQYHYDEWNMTHGLPYSAVRSVFQSSDGYLWLGTRAGICRFDSVTFTNFATADLGSRSVDEVAFFAEDTQHRLWVGTRKGVLWYEKGKWRHPELGPDIDNSEITALLADGDGMYLSTTTKVLRWESNRTTEVELGAKIDLNWYFEALYRARNGDLLVMGSRLIRVKKDGTSEIFDNLTRIPNNAEIRAIAEDKKGGIWLGTKVGLFYLKDDKLERFTEHNGFAIDAVRSLHIDKDDNLWIGTTNGLLRYSRDKIDTVYVNGNEKLSHILYIGEDVEGNLWCGTDSGLLRLHDVKIANLTVRDGLPTNSIQTMLKSHSGSLWVGTNGVGLIQMQPDGLRLQNMKTGLADNTPMALCEAHDGSLWIGYSSNGIDHLLTDGSIEHYRKFTNIIGTVVELSPGDIWAYMLGSGGPYRLVNGVFKRIDLPVNNTMLRAMSCDAKGRLWVAWDRGVAIFENETWTCIDAPEDMEKLNPAVFHAHDDGSMWLLRDGFELQRFRDGKLQRLKLPEAAGRLGYGLVVRNGEAWLSMRNGVLRAKVSDLEAVWDGKKTRFDYTLYNESDGMRSTAPNNISPSSLIDLGPEGIWVSTTKGIAIIQPELIRINKISPNVIIESITADRQNIELAQQTHVPPGRRELAIRYTALSLGDPSRVLFKYRLDGFDNDWIDARRQREVHYGGLSPGTYRFRVIACNTDHLWNETGATCAIIIEPHFYETWWFWLFTGFAIVGCFSLFFWFRTRRLRARQNELVQQVEERTKDLISARDAALAASKSKSEFVANMSHEIRTPMNGVIGMTELALTLSSNKEQSSYLKTVLASGDALMTVINDILDFSKIESGKLDLDPVEFSFAKCIQDVIEPISIRAAQKQIELLCEVDPRIPPLLIGDNARLRQVLFNVLGNAMKFTERGQVSLTITTGGTDPDLCPLLLCVADTGIGIPPDRVEQIFQPFVQADTSMTRRFGGTGLGLTISRQLVELMGGKIWSESELGKGSSFFISLALPVAPAAKTESSPTVPDVRLPGPALVIDDHPDALKAVVKLLAEFQIAPLPAANITEALTLLRTTQTPPSLLIVDEQLGAANGYAAIELIRKMPGCSKIPTILLLASDHASDRERNAELGIEFRLRKPLSREALLIDLTSISKNIRRLSTPPLPDPKRLRSLHILVAEDVPVNQLIVRKMLELGGHSVEIAANGKIAVERFAQGGLDLILMDVQMPVLDGRQAAIQIRQLETGSQKRIPIIALTAHAMQGDAELCLDAGMDSYLTKPLKRQDLNQAMERYFLNVEKEKTVSTAKN